MSPDNEKFLKSKPTTSYEVMTHTQDLLPYNKTALQRIYVSLQLIQHDQLELHAKVNQVMDEVRGKSGDKRLLRIITVPINSGIGSPITDITELASSMSS